MDYKATLVTDSKNPESVSRALNVDNVRMEGLKIATRTSGSSVETVVASRSLATLLSTLDDLIKCQITAEGLI